MQVNAQFIVSDSFKASELMTHNPVKLPYLLD